MKLFTNEERVAILCHLRAIHAQRQLEFIANVCCIFDDNGTTRKAQLANTAYADDPEQLGQTLEVISRRK